MGKTKDFFFEIIKDITSDLASRAIRKLIWGILLSDTFLVSPLLLKLDLLGLIQSKGIMFAFIAYFFLLLGICAVLAFSFYSFRVAFTKNKVSAESGKRKTRSNESQSEINRIAHEKGITRSSAVRILENRKILTSETAKLIDFAVNDALKFSSGVQYPVEPTIEEQYEKAYESGKKLMEYYKNEHAALYFSDATAEHIVELYELITVCLNKMIVAKGGNIRLWNEYSKKLQKVKALRKAIFFEFKKILAT